MNINLDHMLPTFKGGFPPAFYTPALPPNDAKRLEQYPYFHVGMGILFFQTQELCAAFADQREKRGGVYRIDLDREIATALGCPPDTFYIHPGVDARLHQDDVVMSYNGIVFQCRKNQVLPSLKWLHEHRPLPERGFIAMWNKWCGQWFPYEGQDTIGQVEWPFERLMYRNQHSVLKVIFSPITPIFVVTENHVYGSRRKKNEEENQ